MFLSENDLFSSLNMDEYEIKVVHSNDASTQSGSPVQFSFDLINSINDKMF